MGSMPQPDLDAFAETVVLTIKTALAPLNERLAVAEQANRDLLARVQELSGLRDRVTTVEVKSAMPMPLPPAVDLGPLELQIKALESKLDFTEGIRISEVSALGDRIAAVETKSVAPVPEPAPVDLTPVLEKLSAVEARCAAVELLRDRLVDVEIKSEAAPRTPADVLDRIAAVETRLTAAELRAELKATEVAPVLASVADLTKDIGAVRERVAVMEVRAQIPGPAGKDGQNGLDGKDGADGFGFDDLSVDFDEDRTVSLKFQKGDRVKTFPIKFPVMRQQGVYVEGKQYTKGDVATWAGSQWHCETDTTTRPGEGSKAWTLIVKRGRDGKDGRDGRDPVPVVRS